MKTKLSTLISSKLAFRLLTLTFTTLTLTFTACSNDDEDDILGQGEGKQLAQPVAVDFSAGITTRVTTNSEWEIGDLVGISASEIVGTTSTPKYTNVQYKADSTRVDYHFKECHRHRQTGARLSFLRSAWRWKDYLRTYFCQNHKVHGSHGRGRSL